MERSEEIRRVVERLDAHLVVARQIEESGPVPISLEKIDAWEEGSCGWASTRQSCSRCSSR